MRRTFSFGALALLLSGSTLVPAISERALAATRESSQQEQGSNPEVAIREAESAPVPVEPQLRPVPQPIAPVPAPAPRAVLIGTGQASWYGPGFYGNRTANGEVFDMDLISAAHKTLPLPSIVEVTDLDTGRKLKVRVNDRGPFVSGRIIDLSKGAARKLGIYERGVARVRVRYIGPG